MSLQRLQKLPETILIMVAMLSLAVIIFFAGAYLVYPGYLDTGEPNIVALSWRMLNGYPVYLPVDDAIRTSNVYGPYLYLVHAAVFSVIGSSVLIGKLPGILTLMIGLGLVAFAHRRNSLLAICLGLAYCAGIVGLNLPATIWDRPETFLFASVAAGVCLNNLGADQRGKLFRVIGFGLLIGFLMGLKVFAAIYFLPFGLLMLYRDGVRACILTVIIALMVVSIPFMFDAFELDHLKALVHLLADKPNSLHELKKVMRYSLYYIVPALIFVIPMLRAMTSENRKEALILIIGFLIAICLVLYPAQKPGAGMYYMVPFAPIVASLMIKGFVTHSYQQSRFVWLGIVVVLSVNVLAVPIEKRFWRSLEWQVASEVAEEIQAIAASHPDKSIEIGIGDNSRSYRKTFQRTRLVFDGHPYSLDTSIVIETTAWGIGISPATIALISNCSTDVWLIPAGEPPFDWVSFYGNDIYGPDFREAFHEAYTKSAEGKHFDTYRCHQ